MKTQKSLSRALQQSVRLKITTELIVDGLPKSTCHQALVSGLVAVTEPSRKLPSVLPSTAEAATAPANPGYVLLWEANPPCARLMVLPPPSGLEFPLTRSV